jgi:hypothetical protein
MTQDKIKEILVKELVSDTCIHYDWKAAKEIYKLHLEAQLELIHSLNDKYYDMENEDILEDIIGNICEELETKLKELG